jgi:hypothetical protein
MTTFDTLREQVATLVPELTCWASAQISHLNAVEREVKVQNSLALAWLGFTAA